MKKVALLLSLLFIVAGVFSIFVSKKTKTSNNQVIHREQEFKGKSDYLQKLEKVKSSPNDIDLELDLISFLWGEGASNEARAWESKLVSQLKDEDSTFLKLVEIHKNSRFERALKYLKRSPHSSQNNELEKTLRKNLKKQINTTGLDTLKKKIQSGTEGETTESLKILAYKESQESSQVIMDFIVEASDRQKLQTAIFYLWGMKNKKVQNERRDLLNNSNVSTEKKLIVLNAIKTYKYKDDIVFLKTWVQATQGKPFSAHTQDLFNNS